LRQEAKACVLEEEKQAAQPAGDKKVVF